LGHEEQIWQDLCIRRKAQKGVNNERREVGSSQGKGRPTWESNSCGKGKKLTYLRNGAWMIHVWLPEDGITRNLQNT